MKPAFPRAMAVAPVVSLAGTLLLTASASAQGERHGLQELRHALGASRRETRQTAQTLRTYDAMKGDLGRNFEPPVDRSRVLNQYNNQVIQYSSAPAGLLHERGRNLAGQSAFVNDRDRVKAVANGLELDLTSASRNIVLGDRLFASAGSYDIAVGGQTRTLTSGSQVTASEYVALQQVIAGNSQDLALDLSGTAVSGQFSLNSISDGGKSISAAQLVIPANVTVSGDFARSADGVKVTRDFVNFGTVQAYSTDSRHDTARIAARDITNHSGASISTDLNLALNAERSINNLGSITASGNLELTASNLNNGGVISSTGGSVSIDATAGSLLAVNNYGGSINALNGAINVRTSEYDGLANSTVNGGDLLSRELNLNSGQGMVDVFVNQLTGVVKSTGTGVHVRANTEDLLLGSQCLLGDPTYYNTGNIILGGSVVVGEKLAIIAGGNITTNSAVLNIVARDVSGQGYDINIIAGANVTAGSGEVPPAGGPATLPAQSGTGSVTDKANADVSFTGASTAGGNIDLTGATTQLVIDSASGVDLDAGNITLAAYQGTGGGKIILPALSTINTSADGTGNNGTVTVIAGATTGGTTIQLGSIINNGGEGSGGDIVIATATPIFDSGSTMTFDTFGAVTTGNRIIAGPLSANADIAMSSIASVAADISVFAGGNIEVTSFIISQGQNATVGDVNGGNLTLSSQSGTVEVGNVISVDAPALGSGGSVFINASSASPVVLNGIDTEGGPLGGSGGSISIFNLGSGNLNLNGSYTASGGFVSATDAAGNIDIQTAGTIVSGSGGDFKADSPQGTSGSIIITADAIDGRLALSSTSGLPGASASISVRTFSGGIDSNGEEVRMNVDGTLNIELIGLNRISTATAGSAGNIELEASTINSNSSLQSPLLLAANGLGAGGGGNVKFSDDSQANIVIGSPKKLPKGTTHFLIVEASASSGGGDGGNVTLETGGSIFVDTSLLTNQAGAVGTNDGGSVTMSAGSSAPKGGSLIIAGDLNTTGTNGGIAGDIKLESNFSKNFVVGASKQPKNGIFGVPVSQDGVVIISNNGGGVQLLSNVIADELSVEASGKGKILTGKGVELAVANLVFLSDFGGITVSINASSLTVNSAASAVVTSTSAFNTTISGFIAESIKFTGAGRITIDNAGVGAEDGDTVFTTSDQGVVLLSGAIVNAVNGEVILQAANATTGFIDIAGNTEIATSGDKGGDVTLAIGALPKKLLNPQANSVTNPVVTNIGKGQTYFGVNPAGIIFPGDVDITSENKDVIINNASTNSQLIVVGDVGTPVVLHADPPSKVSPLNVSVLGANRRVTDSTAALLAPFDQSNFEGQEFKSTLSSADIRYRETSLLTASGVRALDALPFAPPETASGIGAACGYVWSDAELGLTDVAIIESAENLSADRPGPEAASIRKGAILFAPSKDAKLETPYGTVEIGKDSIAFLIVDENRLAVYDLHDARKGAVAISGGGRKMHLSPGHCVVVTSLADERFEEANPLKRLAYRSVSSRAHAGNLRAFDSEFSIPSAFNSVPTLQSLATSKHQNARKLMERLMKTSAVLIHLGGNRGEFKTYAMPGITAMK